MAQACAVRVNRVGGATAANILAELDWSQLQVVRVWGTGIVTLRPTDDRRFTVTMKPGTYTWPKAFVDAFVRSEKTI